MTEQYLQQEIHEMWASFRARGEMVIDAPAHKVGMPWVAPYEGVCFPVAIDGDFMMVSIPSDQAERFARAIIAMVPKSIEVDSEYEAVIVANFAIEKAKGAEHGN